MRVQGQWVFNSSTQMLKAALAGFGLAYLPEDMVQEHLTEGRLRRVLEDWCPTFPGYHLYYPAASPHRRSRCWSMRCATRVNIAKHVYRSRTPEFDTERTEAKAPESEGLSSTC